MLSIYSQVAVSMLNEVEVAFDLNVNVIFKIHVREYVQYHHALQNFIFISVASV